MWCAGMLWTRLLSRQYVSGAAAGLDWERAEVLYCWDMTEVEFRWEHVVLACGGVGGGAEGSHAQVLGSATPAFECVGACKG